MITAEFYHEGNLIKGILLGKYQYLRNEKKSLWERIGIQKKQTACSYVIFIPWKHREKEIVVVDETDMIHPETIQLDETWIAIDKFISKYFDGQIYHASLEVRNFVGYNFMYENNSFIINLLLHEAWDNLTVLYKNIPQILEIDLHNPEEA